MSYESLARELDRDATSIKRWLGILQNLFVIFQVSPFYRGLRRAIKKEPKFYFYDIGQVKGDNGARFENLVACALHREAHWSIDTQGRAWTLHFVKIKGGKEVDFLLAESGIPRMLVEAKWGEQHFSSSLLSLGALFEKSVQTIQVVKDLRQVKEIKNGPRIVRAGSWLGSLDLR